MYVLEVVYCFPLGTELIGEERPEVKLIPFEIKVVIRTVLAPKCILLKCKSVDDLVLILVLGVVL